MNQNRPFFSTNTNLYDETFRSCEPTILNGENVLLSQEQQRRVYDILNTSIIGNPSGVMWCAQKQFFPGGVLFTFPNPHTQITNNNQPTCCQCCHPPAPPIANGTSMQFNPASVPFNSFFPSSIDFPLIKAQNSTKEQFLLRFHNDRSTSCSDLSSPFLSLPIMKGYPKLHSLTAISDCIKQPQKCPESNCDTSSMVLSPFPLIEFPSNARKLVLSKIVPKVSGHVVDVLNDKTEESNNMKKVSFSDDKQENQTKDQEVQITTECICRDEKHKSKDNTRKSDSDSESQSNNRTKNRRKKIKNSSSDISETTESSEEENEHIKRKWWRRVTSEPSSETQLFGSEEEWPNSKKKKRKRKKKKVTKLKSTKNFNMFSESENDGETTSTHSGSENKDCYCS
ncbi:hypothetical protein ABEB36_010291 [Hypothenemus hampei]|uniref:Uncharacterized protein n=1 Tax=Hypothenemus hampei TaxID=57062 RepID=A0ABD1EJ61_HYPHA